MPDAVVPRFHHVGIQTNDLDSSAAWYEKFFGATRAWSLGTFSELTRSRLPGIRVLTEVRFGDVRLHLFEREGTEVEFGGSSVQFQHVCLAVNSPEELRDWRDRWFELYESGDYSFAFDDPPTYIDIDADGVQSFYAYDPNGLEFEFTFTPAGDR